MAATTPASASLNPAGSRTARERSWPALEVTWVSSVGEPERTIRGGPAKAAGMGVPFSASQAGIHQVSGTRSPAAAARRRLFSLGTDGSLNRASFRHNTAQFLSPAFGIVDHGIVPP